MIDNVVLEIMALLSFTCQHTNRQPTGATYLITRSPIEDNWDLIKIRVNKKLIRPIRPLEFKLYHEGFYLTAAGTYSLNRNQQRRNRGWGWR